MNRNSTRYTVAFTFIVCAFFVFFLALANDLTKEKVAANRRFTERSSVLRALGVPFADAGSVDSVYEKEVTELTAGSTVVYRASAEGVPRFARFFSGPALGGTVFGVLAVDAEVGRVSGLQIVSHNETPGLGGRIDESWFKDQFTGERIADAGIRVRQGSGKGDGDSENAEVDAVTGASLTSKFMETMVNGEIAALRKLRDEGGLK